MTENDTIEADTLDYRLATDDHHALPRNQVRTELPDGTTLCITVQYGSVITMDGDELPDSDFKTALIDRARSYQQARRDSETRENTMDIATNNVATMPEHGQNDNPGQRNDPSQPCSLCGSYCYGDCLQ